jgi:alkanesulfonate monooxygenase SsuD/methylene tetrahydromethanopterin reductase-like flavin-dependent oxidoreductase (luciferase family)
MLFGLALPTGGECGDPRVLVELAELAEAAGWDGVFLEEYVWYQGDVATPRCNTSCAGRNGDADTGDSAWGRGGRAASTAPWNVAREAAGVDQLSEGRLIVGFGSGDKGDPGFSHAGEELDPRARAESSTMGLRSSLACATWRVEWLPPADAEALREGTSRGPLRA